MRGGRKIRHRRPTFGFIGQYVPNDRVLFNVHEFMLKHEWVQAGDEEIDKLCVSDDFRAAMKNRKPEFKLVCRACGAYKFL